MHNWDIYISIGQWISLLGAFFWNVRRVDSFYIELDKKIDKLQRDLTEHRIHGNGKES